ncbi:MAG: DNA-processing protein DprA [Deltaproteobacteria bacterium]|nr:DNA-processing protein DprA [Deltaproteobacteria bacterium]
MAHLLETRTLTPDAPEYPPRARDLTRRRSSNVTLRPPPLYVRGQLPTRPLVALVGTREPSRGSLAWTRAVVRALGAHGYAIGSGGADGIDEAAHRAALEADIPTVVVTVGGLDFSQFSRRAPGLDREVQDAGGALVSLDADGTAPTRHAFFARNELLAALSFVTLALEVRSKPGQGGSGHALRAARSLGRPAATIPHPPWEPGCLGALALHREGFPLLGSLDELLAFLRETGGDTLPQPTLALPGLFEPGSPPRAFAADLSDDARTTLSALAADARVLDAVCAHTSLTAPRAVRALLECTLAGLAVESPPGWYALAPNIGAAGR